ncbi:Hypothetical predicted protein [Paramuricea clavata]|uniref:Uncharacterized protein n=1 Tax=Paramuricea clavata TaxID=317549 RepID=A0A6S7IT00_PARCT|nr:Hypothetical predicted protein [Paramuricea clavata]
MATDAYFDDIKSLKAGQMLNCEIIQSLAESVHDLASVISRVKGNEVKNNSNFSKNTEKSDVKQSQYANFANTKSSFVLEELTDSPMNNNNNNNNDRISPMKENVPESNDNDMSYINLISLMNNNNNNDRISLMKGNVPESNDNDMSHINLNELSTGASKDGIRELVVDEKIDILALSETWLNTSTTNAEVKIQEYNIYRLDRKHKKGGGVCIYVRNDFKTKVLKNLSYISPVGFHQLWLQVQVNKNKSMIVCVTYRPPDCPVTCIRDELKPKFIEALLLGKEIIILGDMNCNLLKTSCYESKILLDTCSELHLTQLIKDSTRITSQTSSLLDVIMISSSSKVKSSGVVDIGISDHSMIY